MGRPPKSEGPSPRDVSQLVPMLVVGAIASVLGILLALAIDWMPIQASEEAEKIDNLWDWLLIFSVPVFVLVEVVVLWSVWKFRMRPGEELMDGPPIHGNTKLEVIWTTIPALMMLGLSVFAYIVLRDIEEAEANQLQVRVVGEQFTWTFYYKGSDGKEHPSPELVVPNNRQIHFRVQSKDVLHDFWVPQMRMKIDAVPGITTNVRWTPKRLGVYPVVCAELCGLGHATMRQDARVVSTADFDKFVADLGKTPAAGGAGTEESGEEAAAGADGKTLFTTLTPLACGACHTLADAGTQSETGPNLDMALEGKDAEFIRQSILEPDAEIAEGFQPGVMPKFDISDEQVDALVNYLEEVAAK